jgi:4-amino-4-deoxy-L-arabinose transferase-like glycosyltransferase
LTAASDAASDDPTPGRTVQRWLLLAIVLFTSLPRLIHLDDDLLGADEWRETETASIARNFSEEASPDILWPRINWGEPGPGYVEAEFQLLPYAVQLFYRATGPQPWIGRAIAVALTALSTLAMFALARRLLGARTALVAALLFGSAPLVFRYGRTFMPEAPTLLCYLLAAERVFAWRQDRRARTLLAGAAALALAILTKPTSIHFGLVVVLLALRAGGVRLLCSRAVLLFGCVALLPASLYYFHAAELHTTYGNTFGVISGGDSKWGSWALWRQPRFWLTLLRIDVRGGTGYAGAALALLALLRTRSFALAAWLAVLLVYYAIVARYAGAEERGPQYHVYAAAPLALATALGAEALWRVVRARWPLRPRLAHGTAALAVLLALAQQWRANVRLLAVRNDVFLRAGRALAEVAAPDDRVVVTSTDVAVEDGVDNNFEEPKVLFHAWRRGRVLARDRLNATELQRAMDRCGARWLVVVDLALGRETADFRAAVATFEVARQGDGYRVLRRGQR